MGKIIADILVECIRGDIASQADMTAVVNAANAWLKTGGGVAGAIHRAAGPGLEEECRVFAPLKPGEAVITGAHGLPNRFVIHCLGPVYGVDKPEDELLASCYTNALALAEKRMISSIAFPAISAGAFRYPVEKAATVAFGAISGAAPALEYVKKIRFVLYSDDSLAIHERILMEMSSAWPPTVK